VGFRARQSLEALGKLPPAFDRTAGTVTAGNSCMITDGAAACVLMLESKAKAAGHQPLGYVKGWVYVGLAPGEEGLMGPAYALPALLDRHGLSLRDVELFEVNEAFAAVVLSTQRALASEDWCREKLGRGALGELDLAKVNVNGGALAVGHPLGASGTRMVGHLARELGRRKAGLGVATLCVHGGLGAAVLVEGA
jgi:acetyl-CoA acyltransferase